MKQLLIVLDPPCELTMSKRRDQTTIVDHGVWTGLDGIRIICVRRDRCMLRSDRSHRATTLVCPRFACDQLEGSDRDGMREKPASAMVTSLKRDLISCHHC